MKMSNFGVDLTNLKQVVESEEEFEKVMSSISVYCEGCKKDVGIVCLKSGSSAYICEGLKKAIEAKQEGKVIEKKHMGNINRLLCVEEVECFKNKYGKVIGKDKDEKDVYEVIRDEKCIKEILGEMINFNVMYESGYVIGCGKGCKESYKKS